MKNPIFSKSCLGWLALWVAFAACERDDTFCNTPHPAEGALLLHTGYAGNYYMKVQDYHTSVPAADFPCPQVFAPGSYTLSDFNRGTAPMMLDATLELMNDALPDADITDWVPSGSEEGDAV